MRARQGHHPALSLKVTGEMVNLPNLWGAANDMQTLRPYFWLGSRNPTDFI